MMRRLVRVPIHLDLWLDAVTEGSIHRPYKCIEGIPADAEFIGSGYDAPSNSACLFFRHDSFPETRTSEIIPEFMPSIVRYSGFSIINGKLGETYINLEYKEQEQA